MRGGALRMRPAAAALAGGLGVLVAVAAPAAAHLRLGDRSLIAAVTAADAMLVARAVEATRGAADGDASTAFALVETLAGTSSGPRFTVAAARPALRHPAGELAVVLVRGAPEAGGLRSTQPAGARLAVPASGLSEAARSALLDLWQATHAGSGPAPGGVDVRRATAALAALAAAPEPRLRAAAAVELATLAAHAHDFAPRTRERMAEIARDPATDAAMRATLELALRRLGAAPSPDAPAPGRPAPVVAGAARER